MSKYQSEFMRIMEERGFIHQCTDAENLDKRLSAGGITAYIGFDCTAPSLHAGSLMQIMVLRWLQKTGHKPVVLMGGGTTKVGDPSGKDEARKLITEQEIQKNLQSIQTVFEQYLTFGPGLKDAVIVNNAEWLDKLNYIEFLRDYGRFFSVNRMLTQDSVKLRLEREQNLSFLEFNYMILQAYDFVELHTRHNCQLQVGGSDQWGNIIMGIDLQRRIDAEKRFQPMKLPEPNESGKKLAMRILEIQPMIQSRRENTDDFNTEAFLSRLNSGIDKELFGLTTPLLTTASGAKMGKTAAGAIWLSKDLLTPYEYWQYWRNTEDADVGKFLRLFTELPMTEIKKLEALRGAEINEAKKVLANEVTKLLHGDRAARQAAETAKQTFELGGTGADIPIFDIESVKFGKGVAAYELFRLCGLSDSGGEAKRLIRGGGARINDRKIDNENELISPAIFDKDHKVKLSAGRKKHMIVRLT